MLTKKGGGSDRSLKGLDDIFVKVNDGGLNNTLAKVACKMKGEGIASVSGCIGNQKKKKRKIFPESSCGNQVLLRTSGENFQDIANSLNCQIHF